MIDDKELDKAIAWLQACEMTKSQAIKIAKVTSEIGDLLKRKAYLISKGFETLPEDPELQVFLLDMLESFRKRKDFVVAYDNGTAVDQILH